MTTLVIADHDNDLLKSSTLNAVTAAKEIGEDIEILIAGKDCKSVAQDAARVSGISKVIVADH
ncbi:MAG: electron transfer flavoprotein subunit alpha/FixB family protein, partial [Pseudomonadota bacterium]|nr:electron transfer flavoprotein subunit alpha/FixB family protein [Pseudomonadota bacterium]